MNEGVRMKRQAARQDIVRRVMLAMSSGVPKKTTLNPSWTLEMRNTFIINY